MNPDAAGPTPDPSPHAQGRVGEGRAKPLALDVVARIGAAIARVADAITSLMFIAVFAAFIYKIVMRYAAGDAVAWADEISVVLFIWIVFLANGFMLDDKRQITFDLVYRHLSERNQRFVAAARSLLVGGIFLCALPASIDYILFLWRERTPVMGWRLEYVYACFALFMLAVTVRLAYRLVLLLSPRWRQGISQ